MDITGIALVAATVALFGWMMWTPRRPATRERHDNTTLRMITRVDSRAHGSVTVFTRRR